LSEETATTFLGSGWPENDDDTSYLLALIRFWGPEFHPDKWPSPVESVDFSTSITPLIDENTRHDSDGDNEDEDGDGDEDEDDGRALKQINPRNLLPFSRGEIAVALALKSSFGWPSDFPEYGGTRIPWSLGYEVFDAELPGELAIIRELALRRSYIEASVSELEKSERNLSYGDNTDIGSILVDRPWHRDSLSRNSEIPPTDSTFSSSGFLHAGTALVNWPAKALKWDSIYLAGSGEQGHGGLRTLLELKKLINQYIENIETSDQLTGSRAWEILRDLYPRRDIAERIQEEIAEQRHWDDLRLAESFMRFGDAHNWHSPVQDPSLETMEVESNADLDEGGWEKLRVREVAYESTSDSFFSDPHSAANELGSEGSKRFFQVEGNNRNSEDIWLVLDEVELSLINQWFNARSGLSVMNGNYPYVICGDCFKIYIQSNVTIRRISMYRPTTEQAKLWCEDADLRRLLLSIQKAQLETMISHGNVREIRSQRRRLKLFIGRLSSIAGEEQHESFVDDFQGILQEIEDALVSLHTRNVTVSPGCLSPLYRRATFYRLEGEYSKAVGDYTEILRLTSLGQAQAMLQGFVFKHRGQAHLNHGQHAEAIQDFSAAIELLPESIDELLNNPDSSIFEDPRPMAHEALDESALKLAQLIQESRYGDTFAEPNFRQALAEWDRTNTTTSEESGRTGSELPPSPPVYTSVEPSTPPSIQRSAASGVRIRKVTDADRIREFVIANYIEPAREQGQSSVTVRAGDVAVALQLTNKLPNVCQAITRSKMRKLANVVVSSITGPNPGANCYIEFLIGNRDASRV